MGGGYWKHLCKVIKLESSSNMTQQSHSWAYTQRKTITQKDTPQIFIAALFTIAKTWKQAKCPSTDEWIKKTWYKKIQWGITQP